MKEQNEDGNDLEFDFENGDYYQGKIFEMKLLLMFRLESESSERENTSDSLSFGSFDYLERSIRELKIRNSRLFLTPEYFSQIVGYVKSGFMTHFESFWYSRAFSKTNL